MLLDGPRGVNVTRRLAIIQRTEDAGYRWEW
jgi:hypothetical protein